MGFRLWCRLALSPCALLWMLVRREETALESSLSEGNPAPQCCVSPDKSLNPSGLASSGLRRVGRGLWGRIR